MDRNIILKKQLFNYLYVIQKAHHYSDIKQKYDKKDAMKALKNIQKNNDYKLYFEILTDPVRCYLEINAPKREKKLEKILVNKKFKKIKKVVSKKYWIKEVSAISEFIFYICEGVAAIAFSMTDNGFTIIYGVSHEGNFVEPGIFFPTTLEENISKTSDYSYNDFAHEVINDEALSVSTTNFDILFWFSERSPTLSEIMDKTSKKNFIITEDNKRFINKKVLNFREQLPLINPKSKTIVLQNF